MMAEQSMYKILEKKKLGKALSAAEIQFVVDGIVDESIPKYQLSALLMAICLKEMNAEETALITKAMMQSGTTIHFKGDEYVDKHSTGGIGDKASLILGPIAAANGVKVPMIAGRGLGHTGGTIDKLESIPGFQTNISMKKFKKLVEDNGQCIISQTKEIAPADGKLYALRDVTATIDNIPLITASIMSKKLAEGANGMVFDIKVGNGAFMRTQSQALKLSKSILSTASTFNRKAVTLLTNMNQPLGRCVGHSIEIRECIEVLKGQHLKEDLALLSIELAANMIFVAGKATSLKQARSLALKSVKNGAALKAFKDLLQNQGGDTNCIDNFELLELAKYQAHVISPCNGYIQNFHNKEIGHILIELGGGRVTQGTKLDHQVGLFFHKKIGEKIKRGERLVTIYHHQKQKNDVELLLQNFINRTIKISQTKIDKPDLIYKVKSNQKIKYE